MIKIRSSVTLLTRHSTQSIIVALVSIVTGAVALLPAGSAYAAAPQHYCVNGTECLNAWNGGPAVKQNTLSAPNSSFTIIDNGGYKNIEYQGSGYTGWCVGDYGNNSSNASTGLVGGCGTSNVGWGANFTLRDCGATGYEFYNVHWGGWLAPSGGVGSEFYLNSATPYCFLGEH